MRIAAVVALVGVGIAGAWAQNAPIDSQSGARTMLALHSPATAAGFGRIERYLLNESALRGRLAALLTLITAREMNLTHEWSIREGAARASGLEAAVIDVIRSNGPVDALSRDDALLIDFGRQLFRNRRVQSATFAALVDRLGRQGAFDAIMLLTYPAMAGVLERAVEQQALPGWSASRLPRLPGVGKQQDGPESSSRSRSDRRCRATFTGTRTIGSRCWRGGISMRGARTPSTGSWGRIETPRRAVPSA